MTGMLRDPPPSATLRVRITAKTNNSRRKTVNGNGNRGNSNRGNCNRGDGIEATATTEATATVEAKATR